MFLNGLYVNVEPVRMKYVKKGYFEICESFLKYNFDMIKQVQDFEYSFKILLNGLFDEDVEQIEHVRNNVNDEIIKELIKNSIKLNEYKTSDERKKEEEKLNSESKQQKENKKDKDKGITNRRMYVLISTYLGFTEREIDDMSYTHFNDIQFELMLKFKYDIAKYKLGSLSLSEDGMKSIIDELNNLNPLVADPKEAFKKKRLTLSDVQSIVGSKTKIKVGKGIPLLKDIMNNSESPNSSDNTLESNINKGAAE